MEASDEQRRICLVGAGYIAGVHADALAHLPGTEVVGVCDPDAARAERLAEQRGLSEIYASVTDLLAAGSCDHAHVLVPPDLHVPVARELVEGGLSVFIEKPLGISRADCEDLVAEAARRGAHLGVNHNSLFFPAYLELRRQITEHALGSLQHLTIVRNLPEGALPPPGHWMLRSPQNLIFESASHPLAQVLDLTGPPASVDTSVSGRRELGEGRHYFDAWQMSFAGESATAQVSLTYGGAFATWHLVAVCDDGMLTADVELNRAASLDKGRWAGYVEPLRLARAQGGHEIRQGLRNFGREALSALRLKPASDPFFASMLNSIAAFYAGPKEGQRTVDGEFGIRAAALCEAVADPVAREASPAAPAPRRTVAGECDATVLGGTGFIGRHLVERMVSTGMTVRVMARNTVGLPSLFGRDQVQVVQGDVADADAVTSAIEGARLVAYLAHGGSFEWEDLEASMIGPAASVADACSGAGVERLVYTGTISSLNLGDRRATITGATAPDSRPEVLGAYGWGKAKSEAVLRERAAEHDLSLCILRPGIVFGEGGTPLHPGLGQWRGDVHCVGWNRGRNPMPLVLVSDVAAAIMAALEAEAAGGGSYNLIGDVRLSARECVEILRETLRRPLVFHPRLPARRQAVELSKWAIKKAARVRGASYPRIATIKTLGCVATFDCSDAKEDLGWAPVEDRADFVERGFDVYGL